MNSTEDPLLNLLKNFFAPRAETDASDEVHCEVHPIGVIGQITFSLIGKRKKYTHEISRDRLESFKGNVHELIDFLDFEVSTAIHRYLHG